MKKTLFTAAAAVLLVGCATNVPTDKTPQTQNGKIYSCMLDRFHELKEDGTIAQTTDDRALAQEVQQQCLRRLKLRAEDFNTQQNTNIAVSIISSMR